MNRWMALLILLLGRGVVIRLWDKRRRKVQISPSRLPCLLPSETAVIPLGLHCSYPITVRETDKAWCWVGALLDGGHQGRGCAAQRLVPRGVYPLGHGWGSKAQPQPQTSTKVKDEPASGTVGLLHFLFNKIINDGKTGSPRLGSSRKHP